jgi:GT2 family glycosyltransferase
MRQELLQVLFDSFAVMGERPARFVIVDNESSPDTEAMVETLRSIVADTSEVLYVPQETNGGGAGGFSAGTKVAYDSGAEWIWLMDDDVKVLPGAITKLRHWTDRVDGDLAAGKDLMDTHAVIQGSRLNFDGTAFYWQYDFWDHLGMPNPIAPRPFGKHTGNADTLRAEGESNQAATAEYRPMNTLCFEGGLFHRSVTQRIGLPDPRFFIYSDDATYGYLASKITRPIVTSDLILERTRELDHHRLGSVRKLNSTSDMTRYHIMRNRGYIAQYLRLYGQYNPVIFGIGTAATWAKEVIRLSLTEDKKSGFAQLQRGLKDAKTLRQDTEWKPMEPLG